MPLSAISLFTGAGGLDYGFEAAGFRTSVALEMDATCCRTLRVNRPNLPIIQADINSVTSDEILYAAGLEPGEADILIGGPPCQPFSKSGYWSSGDSRRLLDPRSSTLTAYLRVLAETRPRCFLLENVEGLGFKGKDEGLRYVTESLNEINRDHGTKYKAAVSTLNAADFGVPQLRRRIFIVGSRDGAEFHFPYPTHIDPLQRVQADTRPNYVTAWDALYDVVPELDGLCVKGKWADLLPTIPEGSNYLWHTARGGGLPLFGWRRRYWNFLLKIAKDRPAWTIQAQPGPATGPFHWENRRLSMEELARLQTFPKGVRVVGSLIEAHRQIGNAVPSLLSEILAREIRTQLLGRRGPRLARSPMLAVPLAKVPVAPPQAIREVPSKYRTLVGDHAPHPGTGKGQGATARAAARAA